MRFDGLTVLVTGAAGGFGKASVEAFYREGARIVASDRQGDPDDLFPDLDRDRLAWHPGDVGEETLHGELVELCVSRFGRLDIAINNAGIVHDRSRLEEISVEQARRVLDIDLFAVFLAMRAQLPVLKRQAADGRGSAVVNLASVAGLGGAPGLGVYAAAKHGVIGLTKTAAAECAGRAIRVNAVCPSYARTAMALRDLNQSNLPPDEAEAQMTRGVPMRRLAEVDEVVTAILFAADPANSFMTGQAIAIDGGITSV